LVVIFEWENKSSKIEVNEFLRKDRKEQRTKLIRFSKYEIDKNNEGI